MGSAVVSILGIDSLKLSAFLTASIGILYVFFSDSDSKNVENKNINEKINHS